MLQFNLLPDVKKQYIKAKKQQRLILSISSFAAGGAIVIVLLLFFFVQFGQKENIKDLTEDINTKINDIKSIEDFNKILTIQSQLETLPELHAGKPEITRLYDYLIQLTPANVKISSVQVNFTDSIMTLEGSAPDLATINRFSDTVKFTKFKAVPIVDPDSDEGVEQQNIEDAEELVPFTDVKTELGRSEDSAGYTLRFTFDPLLFENQIEAQLIIPNIVTTRSTLGKPDITDQGDNPLFEEEEE